ncbi:MAG: FtsW/RodA/SpoVE family cell cycle protein [Turicibacter sp.]|nr:FtsW/RodA/SpoVE family cell cycle protein [Turicibacter sp.]
MNTLNVALIKREVRVLKGFDFFLVLLVLALSIFGVFMVEAVARLLPIYSHLPAQQQFHIATGFFVMLIVAFVDYRIIARLYIPIYVVCMALLTVVLIIGPDNMTATARWIRLSIGGLDLSVQPSEIAKLFLIVSLSTFISKFENVNRVHIIALYLALTAVPVIFVVLQLALSAAVVLLTVGLVILFLSGLYLRTILITTILALPAAIMTYLDMHRQQPIFITQILTERQWIRIQTFINPIPGSDEHMQVERSIFAIGSGGLNGLGFQENLTFVIHGHNDFVFAVAGEQFGFTGSLLILATIGTIIIKCFTTAYRAVDKLGMLLAGGVGGLLLFQTFVNVGVVTGMLPNTGIPFPFMSYGGTHMWTHMAAIGLVLNVGIIRRREDISGEPYYQI